MPKALPCSTGSPARWLRWETRLPRLAEIVPARARATPTPIPGRREAPEPGRQISATPATPRAEPPRTLMVRGVPKAIRAPARLQNTISENRVAISPEGMICSAR